MYLCSLQERLSLPCCQLQPAASPLKPHQHRQHLQAAIIIIPTTQLPIPLPAHTLRTPTAPCLQIQDLLEWLLQRGRELNATAQLGPQGLGATAGAVSRLQQAQRQQQQQAAQQQQQALRQQQQQEAEAAARMLRQQQAAAVERDQLMRELVDAAVSQKHRLSPQVGTGGRVWPAAVALIGKLP